MLWYTLESIDGKQRNGICEHDESGEEVCDYANNLPVGSVSAA